MTLSIAIGDFADWSARIRANLDAHYTPDFVDLSVADFDAYDVIIPLARRHAEALGRRPDLKGRKFLHPSPETVALCHDKLALTRFLIAEGFGDFVPSLRAPGAPYPYVWKRRQSAFGRDCHIVRGPEDERDLDPADPDWFAQVVAPAPIEYATHILRAGGKIHYVSSMTYQLAGPGLVLGQLNAPRAIRLDAGCPHLDIFAAILDRLDYEGVTCIDYKVEGGRPLIFEINPRFGGSLCRDATAFVEAYIGALGPREPQARGDASS